MTAYTLREAMDAVKADGRSRDVCCPAHDDVTASLSVSRPEEKVLLCCHAGCATEAVIAAGGLHWKDLFESDGRPKQATKGEPVTVYDYRDAAGMLIYQNCRYEPKHFRLRRPDGSGGWIWNLDGTERLPYRLPLILGAETIWIFEGERDADCAANDGFDSTSSKSIPVHPVFRGKKVCIIQDHDSPGVKIANGAAAICISSGAASVKIVSLSQEPLAKKHGKDYSYWRKDHKPEELRGLADSAEEFVGGTTTEEKKAPSPEEIEAAAAPVMDRPVEAAWKFFDERIGGDSTTAKLVYLACTSRLLKLRRGVMPCHTEVLGEASSGKNYQVDTALEALPGECVIRYPASSLRAFIYDHEANLRHAILYFSEMDSIPQGEEASVVLSALRHLLQHNHLEYYVTVRGGEKGFHTECIKKEGPTALVLTGTKRFTDDNQMDSRLHVINMDESTEQLHRALDFQTKLDQGEEELTECPPALVAFQRWLQAKAPFDVVVPYADQITAGLKRTDAGMRLNRDRAKLIALIKACTILNSAHRVKDYKGRFESCHHDYGVVWSLLHERYTEAVTDGPTTSVRELLAAVGAVGQHKPVKVAVLARVLKRTARTVQRQARKAVAEGWLVDRGKGEARSPLLLDVGDPPPAVEEFLPNPIEIQCRSVADWVNPNGYNSLDYDIREKTKMCDVAVETTEEEDFNTICDAATSDPGGNGGQEQEAADVARVLAACEKAGVPMEVDLAPPHDETECLLLHGTKPDPLPGPPPALEKSERPDCRCDCHGKTRCWMCIGPKCRTASVNAAMARSKKRYYAPPTMTKIDLPPGAALFLTPYGKVVGDPKSPPFNVEFLAAHRCQRLPGADRIFEVVPR